MRNKRRAVKRTRFSKPRGSIIVVDTETTGVRPFHWDRIFLWAYITNKGEWAYYWRDDDNIKWLWSLLTDASKTIVFHNAKFDLEMIQQEGFDLSQIKAKIHCTMLQSKVLRSTSRSHKLEDLGKRIGRETEDKTDIKDWVKAQNKKSLVNKRGRKVGFQDAPHELVQRRVLWDVETTLYIHLAQYHDVINTCPELYENELELMFECIDMETRGTLVDLTRAKRLKREASETTERIRRELNDLCLPIVVQRKRKGETVEETIEDEFNCGSNQHLAAAFQKLGIELKYKTKPKKGKKGGPPQGGGNWSFDEYSMIRYVPQELAGIIRESSEEGWSGEKYYKAVHDAVRKHNIDRAMLLPCLVLRYRELTKMVSTYYDHFINNAVDVYERNGREYGTLHCKFNQAEAMTGRFSSSDPNLQNQPRLNGPRECFVPRPKTRTWYIDYEQVEMKMFVHFADDDDMAKAIADDIHLFVACQIYELPADKVSKEQRKRAKSVNFGIIYGSGAQTQSENLTKKGLPTPVNEAKRFIANYHHRFPSVRRLTAQYERELRKNGFITNPYGRRYHIEPKFAYKALNYMCQGTSADLIKFAMVRIRKWLKASGFKTRIIKTIHDELAFEVPINEERRVVPQLIKLMEVVESYKVPITVDADVARKRWSQKSKPSWLTGAA